MKPMRNVILIVSAVALLSVPSSINADIILPTLADCETVENNLANWESLTPSGRNWTAETGQACEEQYPTIYDNAPTSSLDGDEGETCDAFGALDRSIACSHAYGNVNSVFDEECEGKIAPSDDHVCYRTMEYGSGWSDYRPTSGHVVTSGKGNRNDGWTIHDPPVASTPEVEDNLWGLPGEVCLTVTTTTAVYVWADELELPGSGISDSDSEQCT